MVGTLQIQSTIGDYRLVDFLGAGGMGEVYRAVHTKIGRVVAVKVLTRAVSGEDFVKRFVNEARILAGLHHPHIVTLYDFTEFRGWPCIIMEYVDGATLADRIRLQGPLPGAEAIPVLRDVLGAVHYIHQQGIIHRDIKSNNVKIASNGQVKLLDFGIARAESAPRFTAAGAVVGTSHYLAPELVGGAAADCRSDIWALGVLLYEMLTARAPFDADTTFSLYEKIRAAQYTPASRINPAVPARCDLFIGRCLKKDPADRFQSAHAALEALVDPEESGAQPGPERHVPRRLRPGKNAAVAWLRENWPVSAAGAVLLVVIMAGLILMTRVSEEKTHLVSQPETTEHQSPAQGGSFEAAGRRTVRIEVAEGTAAVFRDGARLGDTPYDLSTRLGERVTLTLKREGCADKPISFTVTASTRTYTFRMQPRD